MKATGRMTLNIERLETDELNHTRLTALDQDGCPLGEALVEYGAQELDGASLFEALYSAPWVVIEMPHGMLEIQIEKVIERHDGAIRIRGEGEFEGRANCWTTGLCGIGRFYGTIKSVETSAWTQPIPWVLYDSARRLAGEWLPDDTPSGSRGSVKRVLMKDIIQALLGVNHRATLTE